MRRRAVVSSVAGLLGAALLAGCGTGTASSTGAVDKGYISGDGTVTVTASADRREPVELAGRTLEGRRLDVADFRGDVVVVNVWGSWCPPCIKEAPDLERVWRDVRSQDVQFLGVDTRDQRAAALAHQRRFDVTYPSLDDRGGRLLLAFRGTLPPSAIPSTLVLDRRGRVAARVLGGVNASTLRGLIDDVLAERTP